MSGGASTERPALRAGWDFPRHTLAVVSSKAGILLFLPLLAVGLVSFVIVRSQQGEGGTFVARQQQAEALTPAKIVEIVRAAPESPHGPTPRRVSCRSLGSGELHNPWRCTLDYRDGKVIDYRVMLNANGSYIGDQQVVHDKGRTYTGPGQITGCCVAVP